ncbi:MAG: TonB-dependent receptor domain-containing protein [Myxococcota bacterium]
MPSTSKPLPSARLKGALPRRWSLLSGLLCSLSLLSPAHADDRADARRHFLEGMRLIKEGRYEEGLQQLERAHEILPHPAVLFNMGRACFEAGDYPQAIARLEQYLATAPEDAGEAQRLLNLARQRRTEMIREGYGASSVRGDEAARQPSDIAGKTAPPEREAAVTSPALAQALAELRQAVAQVERAAYPTGPARTEENPSASGTASPSVGAPPAKAPTRPDNSTVSPEALPREADPYALEVITSSRYAQQPLDAPGAITVISGDELRRSGALSVPEALRRVPGMEVMALNPADYSVGVRGFNALLSNKVLVLVDGRSIYLDFIGATLWTLQSISLQDIERIEVIRGPGAALYGAGAFSGVVNIITRPPGATGSRPTLVLRGGLPDYALTSLSVSGRQDQTAFRASAGFETRARYAVEVDPDRQDYELKAPYPSEAAHISRLDLRVDRRLAQEISLSVSGGLAQGQTEFMAIGALRDYVVDGLYGYARADLLLPLGFSFRTFWNHFDMTASPWAIPVGGLDISSHPKSHVVDVELENSQRLDGVGSHRIHAGLGYRYKGITWEWLPLVEPEQHASAFVQVESAWSEPISTTLSLRADRHPLLATLTDASLLDKLALSPRGAFLWHLTPESALRLVGGTAFRTPTFFESYISQAIPTSTDAVAVLTQGNLQLRPERIVSFELGFLQLPDSEKYQLESCLFLNRVNGLLELTDVEPWPEGEDNYHPDGYWYAGTTRHVNVDEPHTAMGLELGGKLSPREGLDLYANYALTWIQQGDGADAEPLASTSPHKLNAGLRISRPRWSLSTDLHAVSSQTWNLRSFDANGQVQINAVRLPARATLNARLATQLEGGLELALEGRNLLAPLHGALEAGPVDSDDPTGATVNYMATEAGTYREHPLAQPLRPSVGVSLSMPLW